MIRKLLITILPNLLISLPVIAAADFPVYQQAPMLCGVTAGEMVLSHYNINSVGKSNEFKISSQSKGSAVGQYICELIETKELKTNQPKCRDQNGNYSKIYDNGRVVGNTKTAYVDGTYLPNLAYIFKENGLKTYYKRSIFNQEKKVYEPDKVAVRAKEVVWYLQKGAQVIIHVTPRLKRGGGHYLVAYDYNPQTQEILFIDPNKKNASYQQKRTVSFRSLATEKWFRDNWFFTGRYLAVIK